MVARCYHVISIILIKYRKTITDLRRPLCVCD